MFSQLVRFLSSSLNIELGKNTFVQGANWLFNLKYVRWQQRDTLTRNLLGHRSTQPSKVWPVNFYISYIIYHILQNQPTHPSKVCQEVSQVSRILLTGEVQHGNLSILNLFSYLLRTKDIWDKSLFDEPVCDQHCLINSAKKMFGSKKFKKFSFEGPFYGLSSALVKLPNILRRAGRSLQGFVITQHFTRPIC